MADKLTVGIDLGTSSCSVGIIRDEQFSIFKDDKGNETTPSYVAFTESGRLIGQEAKDQVTINPKNTVYGIKRLIGKHHSKVMEEGRKLKLPFQTSLLHNSNSHIAVEYKRRNKLLEPKQVSAMLLVKMRKIAEQNLGQNVHGAVISVPANFNSYQRQATVDAATIAGFKEINLINEPTASAIAFSCEQKCEKYRNVLIADFGGGFFSLTVARVKSYDVQILASCVEDFGGIDIDQHIFDRFVKEISAKICSEVREQKSIERLKQACEAAKKDLSHNNARIHLDSFNKGNDVDLKVTKTDFNTEVGRRIVSMFAAVAKKVFHESKLYYSDIENIAFVGKSWNHSYFQETFLSLFIKGNPPSRHMLNAVLYGATIHAARQTNSSTATVRDVIHRSVELQHSLDGHRKILLRPTDPIEKANRIQMKSSNQYNLIEVCDRSSHPEQVTIGRIVIGANMFWSLISASAYGTFQTDRNGIVNGLLSSKLIEHLVLKLHFSGQCYPSHVMLETQFQSDENEVRKLEEESQNLEELCLNTRHLVKNCDSLSKEDKERYVGIIDEVLWWIDDNPKADEVEFGSRKLKIKKIYTEVKELEKYKMNEVKSQYQKDSASKVQAPISEKNHLGNTVPNQMTVSSKCGNNSSVEMWSKLTDNETQEVTATLKNNPGELRNDCTSECKENVVIESIDGRSNSVQQRKIKNKNSETICSRISSSSQKSIPGIDDPKKKDTYKETLDNKLGEKLPLISESEEKSLEIRTKNANHEMNLSHNSVDYNSSFHADERSATNSSHSVSSSLKSSSQVINSESFLHSSASLTSSSSTSAKSPSLQIEKNQETLSHNGDAVPTELHKSDSESYSEQKHLEAVKGKQSLKREGYGGSETHSGQSYSEACQLKDVKGKFINLPNTLRLEMILY